MDKQILKEECSPESISEEFQELFRFACEATSHDHLDKKFTSSKYIRNFYEWIKQGQTEGNDDFRELIEAVTKNDYQTFLKWQSNGSPHSGNKPALCLGASAQFRDRHIEEHFAKFLNKWINFIKNRPEKPDFLKFKNEIKNLREKYGLIPVDRSLFLRELERYLDSQSPEPIENFDKIRNFIDTHSSGYITIEGKIGEARSRLIAYTAKKLYDAGQYQCIWHFNQLVSGHNRSADLLRSIFSQLKDMYLFLEENPFNIEYDRALNSDSGYAAFYQDLFVHLATEEKLKKTKLIIFVDALNEVSQHDKSRQEMTNTLFLPPSLINNVFIVVTSKNFDRETYKGNKLEINLAKTEPPLQKDSSVSKNENDADWLDPYIFDHIPLFGREDEIKQLNQFVRHEDSFKIWAIVGPSGAGKTRLTLEWASKLIGWKYFVLHKEDREPTQWDNWHPLKPTVIIIDYMFGFDEVITKLIHRFKKQEYEEPYIRLLLIDHVFDESLCEDPRWGFSRHKSSFNRNAHLFFNSKALDLRETKNQKEIITSIIRHRAPKEVTTYQIEVAHKYLEKMPGAYHPLFAVLLGDAIKSGQDFTKWNRRKLIDYYLSGDERLPWEKKDSTESESKIRRWASYFVAAATARGKMDYGDLIEAAGNRLNHIDDAKSICQKIIADTNDSYLEAFKPDILGESFILKLLHYIYGSYVYPDEFRQVFTAGDEKTQAKDAIEFLGFIQRLTRNLLNDDMKDVKVLWNALFKFMNPSDFENSESLKWAISASLIDIAEAIKDQFPEEKIALVNKIESAVLNNIKNEELLQEALIYSMHHFEYFGINNELTKEMEGLFARFEANNKFGETPIMFASYHGFNKVINAILLDHKVEIEAPTSEGLNSLIIASAMGHVNTVKLLLEKGAEVGAIDHEDRNALMHAIAGGHTDTVKLLIEEGAKIEAIDHVDRSSLMYASVNGNVEIVRLLLERNMIENSDYNGNTALIWASRHGNSDTVRLLIENEAMIDVPDHDGITALMWASRNGHANTVRLLLHEGANPEATDVMNNTALMWASEYDHADTVKLLLDAEVNFEAIDYNGQTALISASWKGHTDTVKLLLDKGANPDAIDYDASTALLGASANGHAGTVKLLIDKEVNLDAIDNVGSTALMWACYGDHIEVVKLLLKKQARTDVIDNDGKTALSIATTKDNKEIIQLLIDHGAMN